MFQFGEKYLKSYIDRYSKKHLLNEICVQIISETVVNIIDMLFEQEWDGYIEQANTILELLSGINETHSEEMRKKFHVINRTMFDKNNPVEIMVLGRETLRLLRICLGKFTGYGSDLKLEKISEPWTKEQEEAAQEVVQDHLDKALDVTKTEIVRRRSSMEREQETKDIDDTSKSTSVILKI